jgi:hypothetical protein
MLATPALYPRDLLGAAEVALVLGFGEPPALTGRLARLSARGSGAIPLVPHIAWVRPEQHPATQALTLSLAFHGPALLGARSCTAARELSQPSACAKNRQNTWHSNGKDPKKNRRKTRF